MCDADETELRRALSLSLFVDDRGLLCYLRTPGILMIGRGLAMNGKMDLILLRDL